MIIYDDIFLNHINIISWKPDIIDCDLADSRLPNVNTSLIRHSLALNNMSYTTIIKNYMSYVTIIN